MEENAAPPAHTLVDLLRRQADRYGDKVAFSFSYNGDGENVSELTYRELDLKARAIAARLQHQGAGGQRVLVFCRPGLGHIAGFFGCVYAGAIPVPVHERLAPRLASVIPDAQAGFALAAPETPAKLKTAVDDLVGVGETPPVRWGLTDAPVDDADNWVPPDIDTDTTALVQYTSGTTRAPKGIVVTHRNVLHNLETIHQAWHGDDREIAVYWLPQHHDMGLIGSILEMVYIGCTTVLMSPAAFIKRPMRWLEAISRHGATFTAAPNFAFDLCVEHSTPEQRATLDLSTLSTVMNGAEPVRPTTLRSFADAFGPAGFRPIAVMPIYGQAEATALISGGSDSPGPVTQHIDRAALGQDRVVDATSEAPTAVALVSCGRPQGGQRVVIVNPETRDECGPDEVGEIWVTGPIVAQGYWNKPTETEQTFAAHLADTGQGPFLRTGDLGFLRSGELFVTGRCKDLVMVGGNNYYPNDIEATVQGCHSALSAGRGAVFSVMPESGAAEELTVVQEVDGHVGEAEFRGIVGAIQTAIAEHHLIQAHTVVLVAPMQIPTTSSGKIQRGQCRQQFCDGELETVAEWYASSPSDDAALSAVFLKSFTKNRDPRAADGLAKLVKAASAQQHRHPVEPELSEGR
jgi:acyl-CoA synthetase (AMP-forming)/AMP-acid ligase II